MQKWELFRNTFSADDFFLSEWEFSKKKEGLWDEIVIQNSANNSISYKVTQRFKNVNIGDPYTPSVKRNVVALHKYIAGTVKNYLQRVMWFFKWWPQRRNQKFFRASEVLRN